MRWAWIAIASVACGGMGDAPVRIVAPEAPPVEEDTALDEAPVPDPEPDPAPDVDPFGMVSAHNRVRANAVPVPDPALVPLEWDDDLAEVAQEWADRCVWEHSTNAYGENLYASSWASNGVEAVDSWAAEDAYYDYDSNECSYVCGHYTQIVWRDTTKVGCAYADCAAIDGIDWGGRLWVCNYDPPGNYVGQRPY